MYIDKIYTYLKDNINIMSDEGVIIAEYIEEYNTIVFLFNIYNDTIYGGTKILLKTLEEHYKQKELTEEDRRKREYDKKIKNIANKLSEAYKKRTNEQIQTITNTEANIQYARSRLIQYNQQLKLHLEALEQYKTMEENAENKVKEELNNILSLDKINGVDVHDNMLIVNTKLLYAYTERGEMYKLSTYEISIDLDKGIINFECPEEDRRESFWGYKCMHPHISEIGEACFGNADATIAQLMADLELFALVTILINYLESINTKDLAGGYCVNWDEVDPNTLEVIKKGGTDCYVKCECCGSSVLETETTHCQHCDKIVCSDCSIYLQDVGDYACADCDDIFYCDNCDLYYSDDSIIHCEYCDNIVCDNCAIYDEELDMYFCCERCRDDYKSENKIDVIKCNWCGKELQNDIDIYTCESCGEQGCNECVILENTTWKCPECRGDN